MLESGSREYVDAYSVPSRLSASFLVRKGHEDSVRRYSEMEKEGEVQSFVEIAAPIREVVIITLEPFRRLQFATLFMQETYPPDVQRCCHLSLAILLSLCSTFDR